MTQPAGVEPATWRATFDAQPIYGDGMNAVRLSPSRAAFLTGDAVPRDGGPWGHSSITVVDVATARGHVVRPNYVDAPSPYQVIPDDGGSPGGYHWLGPTFAADGVMYVLAPHNVVDPANGFGFRALGTDWATFDVRAEPHLIGLNPTPSSVDDPVTWSAGVWYDRASRYVYVAGVSRESTDGWTGHDVYVARVPISSVADPHAWSYLARWRWSPDPADALPVMTAPVDGGVETSFSFWRDAYGWHVASRLGGAWGRGDAPEVDVWTTTSIVSTEAAPPSWRRAKAIDLPLGEPNAYLANVHWELPRTPAGRLVVTYNQAGRETTWVAAAE